MSNQKTLYNSKKISDDYAKRDYLEKAEKAILEELSPKLANMSMLDMGVGGGRTTTYFAPMVKSYIGADYAPQMIRICKEKFKDKYTFIESDARDMKEFKDCHFDFVLFSYNGIDSFGHNDRIAALGEIRRVLKNNGYFCFSSHNLGWKNLSDLLDFRLNNQSDNSKKISKGLFNVILYKLKIKFRIIRLNLLNGNLQTKNFIKKLKEKSYGRIYDNSLHGKGKIYYITHQGQLEQLKAAGFANIDSFSRDGIKTENEEELNNGGWIYYLCQASK